MKGTPSHLAGRSVGAQKYGVQSGSDEYFFHRLSSSCDTFINFTKSSYKVSPPHMDANVSLLEGRMSCKEGLDSTQNCRVRLDYEMVGAPRKALKWKMPGPAGWKVLMREASSGNIPLPHEQHPGCQPSIFREEFIL